MRGIGIFAGTLVSLLVTLVACSYSGATPSPQEKAPEEKGAVFSLSLDKLRNLVSEQSLVVVRILDSCDEQHQIVLFRNSDGHRSARAASIKQGREISVDTISAKISEELLDLAFVRLQDLMVSPAREGPLVLHGNHYELWFLSTAGESYFYFQGVPGDPAAPPLQRWIDDLVRLVGPSLKCVVE